MRRQVSLRYKRVIPSTLSYQNDPPRACSSAVPPPSPLVVVPLLVARPRCIESPDCASTPTCQDDLPRAWSYAVPPPPPLVVVPLLVARPRCTKSPDCA